MTYGDDAPPIKFKTDVGKELYRLEPGECALYKGDSIYRMLQKMSPDFGFLLHVGFLGSDGKIKKSKTKTRSVKTW